MKFCLPCSKETTQTCFSPGSQKICRRVQRQRGILAFIERKHPQIANVYCRLRHSSIYISDLTTFMLTADNHIYCERRDCSQMRVQKDNKTSAIASAVRKYIVLADEKELPFYLHFRPAATSYKRTFNNKKKIQRQIIKSYTFFRQLNSLESFNKALSQMLPCNIQHFVSLM